MLMLYVNKRRRKRFPFFLTGRDAIDTELWIDRGRLVGFALNHRAWIEGDRREVVRYDTRHGRLHVHRFWRPPGNEVEMLETGRPARDYTRRFEAAKRDLLAQWRVYRRRVERRWCP